MKLLLWLLVKGIPDIDLYYEHDKKSETGCCDYYAINALSNKL